jgi:16S rRNA G966 N2-methylase RsmD
MENLLKFIAEHSADNVSRLILDRKKYPDIDIDLAVNCIESRRKLKGKVQEWYENPELIFPLKLSAEQCSSSATGAYKAVLAERIAGTDKGWRLADLTGGLGVDSWFFSQRASKVIYNEMQQALCDAARHNFKTLGATNITISNSIASEDTISEILFENVDIVYMDPARRGEGGKKVFLLEDCTPDVLTLKDIIFRHAHHILLKLSPMADITMACKRLGNSCREVHVVGAGGECKELLIWMDKEWNEEYTLISTELHPGAPLSIFSFKPSEEKSATGSPTRSLKDNSPVFLFEPGKALMKAGAFNLISQRFEITKLGRSTHYYTMDNKDTALALQPYGKVYEILECEQLNKRNIKDFSRKYPKAEVTARNIEMDTETLKKKMGITSGDDAHIFGLKSDSEGNLIIAARRLLQDIRC